MQDTPTNNKPPRNTLANFAELLKAADFKEISKVIRRRVINGLKFIRRIILVMWRAIYENPLLLKPRQKRQLMQILKRTYGYAGPKPEHSKISIGLIIRDGQTHPKSSAFIRLIAPLTHPRVSDRFSLTILPENTTQVDETIGTYIVQRTAYDNPDTAQAFINNAASANKKIVVDTDDAFDVIDASHPESLAAKEQSAALQLITKAANQVWVSTKSLRDSTVKLNKNTVTVANYLDQRLWNKKTIKPCTNKKLQLIYMGTGTHDADLNMIMPQLDKLWQKYPETFCLTVVGVSSILPEREWIKRKHVRRSLTLYPKFVKWFLKKGPYDIGLCPLVNTPFNNSKSDIKCLDYLANGILPYASNLTPYQDEQLSPYIVKVDDGGWFDKLSQAIEELSANRDTWYSTIKKAQNYITDQRSTDSGSKRIAELLDSLDK